MYSNLARNVIIPLYDFATGNPTRKYMSELEKSQWFSTHELREAQNRRLRALIEHSYRTVPYYRRIFRERKLRPDDVKDREDLHKLPILERSDVQNNLKELISTDYPRRDMRRGNTGGSTGEPLKFFTTKENRAWSNASRYLAWRWAGFEVGDKYACIFGSPIDLPRYTSMKGKLEGLVKRRISLNSYCCSETDMEKFAHKIVKSKPEVIYGNAVPVAVMARFIEERGIKGIQAKSVIIDSNQLFKREVETIERVFHCRVWWNYHNRENGTFASECSEHNGYHLFVQNFIFEFLREGSIVGPGETGNIVVTDLHNCAMPFIRYEVGDVGTYSEEVCVCGRSLPLMPELQGRRCDILVTETGRLVSGLFYQFERFFDIANIRQFQIIQESRERILIKIVVAEGYSDRDMERIRNMVHFIMGQGMQVDIKIVESIASSKSGKRRSVIRKFPIDFNA